MRRDLFAIVFLVCLLGSFQARSAVITDIQSSFDKGDPFDIKISLGYDFRNWNTLITREDLAADNEIVPANKLEYDRAVHMMHVGMAIGLYKDLELYVDLPIIFADEAKLGLHPGVADANACGADPHKTCIKDVDPSATSAGADPGGNTGTLIDVPSTGNSRSGLGDLGVGIRWAPWHYLRERQYPSWVVGIGMRVPTAKVKKADNRAVGEGLIQLDLNTAISRRVVQFFEPYFELHGNLKFATDKSLFDVKNAKTQTLDQPGHRMGLKLGAEFIPWEVMKEDRHVAIHIGGGLDYVFEGREYTELFEGLGNSPCRTSNGCDGTTYAYGPKYLAGQDGKEAEIKDKKDKNEFERSDGITDVEHYSLFSFWAGLDVQPVKYVQLGFLFQMAYVTPHFITFADAGKDSLNDNDYFVTGYNSLKENEYNPKYIEDLDEVGTRFRASQSLQWNLLVSLSGRF